MTRRAVRHKFVFGLGKQTVGRIMEGCMRGECSLRPVPISESGIPPLYIFVNSSLNDFSMFIGDFSLVQLFYPNAKGKDLWYDPVFRVETIDGRNVWCKVSTKSENKVQWHRPFLICVIVSKASLQSKER